MNKNQLQAIKTRAEAATPGPWSKIQTFSGQCYVGESKDDDAPLAYMKQGFDEQARNAEFIAAARTDIPALLQTIELLQAENQMLVSACQNVLADAKARPGAYLYADLTALRIAVEEDQ